MAAPPSATVGRRHPSRASERALAGSRRRWRAHDHAIVRAARALADGGLVVGTVGNVSARIGRRLHITPSRTPYDRLRRRDLVAVDLHAPADGATGALPSRELPLHLAVYRARPDAAAIVHTHSVAATAWSFLDEPLGPPLEELAYYGIGPVSTAAPAAPGTLALADNAVTALGRSRAVLLGRHGVLAVGSSVGHALVIAQVVEHQAKVAWTLRGRTA